MHMYFFFSSRRRHTRWPRDWSSDVCSSDLDCFDLAADIRTLDMEASPYDLRGWGYGVVAVETAAGKAEYMRRQKEFSARAQSLRQRLLDALASAGIHPR